MNETVYDEENKIASIQPGSKWKSVYDTLTPHGVTVTGGRADLVGVGGFITGGGYSFHLGSRGFACDNVLNFEVVLASGEIVNANRDVNPDLWRGLKGSSGNLGFVTRFDMGRTCVSIASTTV
jgi:FAD/FMN-containing dehydrogenase